MVQKTDAKAPGDLAVVPALFEHSQNVYKEMVKSARHMPEYDDLLVYEGHLTQLFKRLRLAVPYYTEIKNHLTHMGCIEQVRRGGGSAESRWVLWKEPDLEEWKDSTTRPRRGNKTTMHEQQIRILNERLASAERHIEVIETTLELVTERLATLEERTNG